MFRVDVDSLKDYLDFDVKRRTRSSQIGDAHQKIRTRTQAILSQRNARRRARNRKMIGQLGSS